MTQGSPTRQELISGNLWAYKLGGPPDGLSSRDNYRALLNSVHYVALFVIFLKETKRLNQNQNFNILKQTLTLFKLKLRRKGVIKETFYTLLK